MLAAGDAVVDDPEYLDVLGVQSGARRARDVWNALLADAFNDECNASWRGPVEFILSNGTLAQRIVRAVGVDPDRARIRRTYAQLCDCLDAGVLFR
jgi:hypothetical protein